MPIKRYISRVVGSSPGYLGQYLKGLSDFKNDSK